MTLTAPRTQPRVCTQHTRPPTEAGQLRADITAVCAQIDRRLGNRPGTAERGTYFWFWPRTDDVAVLTALHADAVQLLAAVTTTTKGTPA